MGAKSALKLRNRGIAYKCDLCGRKLMSPDALVAHQRTAHNIITRRTRPKQVNKTVRKIKLNKQKKLPTPPAKEPSPQPSPLKKVEEDVKEKEVEKESAQSDSESAQMIKNMVEFECPKCFKRFLTYFPAHKHIQKYHCVNRMGSQVPPNSPNLIQPIRIEQCVKCNRKVKSIHTHICDQPLKEVTDKQVFICTACDECFPNLKAFDCHVLSTHGACVESMFFPTSCEFINWKTDMEQQTNVNYTVLDKYDTKRYYHCNYVKENPDDYSTTYFCPSTIVIQEFCKGIQVHFYKQHYKHTFTEYQLCSKYKKYSITSFLKRSDNYNNLTNITSDENDLYMQFKTLMEGIVVDAAKINIATLRIILGKALEITSILTNYDEEVEDNENMSSLRNNNSQNLTESEITRALEESDGKRSTNETVDSEVKRPKLDIESEENSDVQSPKILNSFSLADTAQVNKVDTTKESNKINETEEIKVEEDSDVKTTNNAKNVDDIDTPSSFNDSYKDFVVKNFPTVETIANRTRSKPVVKTRMGEFKPSLSPKSPKADEKQNVIETPTLVPMKTPRRLERLRKYDAILKPVETSKLKSADNIKIKSAANSKLRRVESPKLNRVDTPKFKSDNITKLKFIDSPKQKLVEKTKSTKTPPLRLSFDKPKVDFEYEVKEQEDGCNILILKM